MKNKNPAGDQLPMSRQDNEALRGFIRDGLETNYPDAAAMAAALTKRTGATDRQLLLAAIDLLRELTAAQRETGDGTA